MTAADAWPAGVEAACSFLYLMVVVSCEFRPKLKAPLHAAVIAGADLLFFLAYRPVEIQLNNYTAYLIILLVCSLLFATVCLHGDPLNMVNFVVICNFAVVVLKSIVLAACGGFIARITSPMARSLIWHAIYYVGLAACGWFFIHFATRTRLPRRYWMALAPCTFTVAVLATFSGQSFMQAAAAAYNIFNIATFWLILLLYYLTHLIAGEFTRRLDAETANTRLSAQLEQFERTQAAIEQFRRDRHKMKNTYFYINALVKRHEYAALEHYLDTELNYRITEMEEIRTGNPTLDLMLTQKIGEARRAHIGVTTNLTLPANLPFPDQDLCALLLNLLDSAIDASIREPARPGSREIAITLGQTKNFLRVEISNRTSTDVLKENRSLHTTKTDKANHGIGLQVVRSIVDKYDGMLRYDSSRDRFAVSVLLQFPEQSGETP